VVVFVAALVVGIFIAKALQKATAKSKTARA